MVKGTRVCKVCGKEYPYCKTFRPTNMFRWEDVACCPEHATLYFSRVEASRSVAQQESSIDTVDDVLRILDEINDDEDEIYDESYECDDECEDEYDEEEE